MMRIHEIRSQLHMAQELAKAGIGFVVVPVTTPEEQAELAFRAILNIEKLEAAAEIGKSMEGK